MRKTGIIPGFFVHILKTVIDVCSKLCYPISEVIPVKGVLIMKIAVTYANGEIFQHFGHTEIFKLYEIENNQVTGSRILLCEGSGHGALASLLAENNVDILICGGIGGGAQNALASVGIRLFGGVSGNADEAVNALISGSLNYNPDVKCNHHGEHHHEEGHTCGSHGCGSHSCGHHE